MSGWVQEPLEHNTRRANRPPSYFIKAGALRVLDWMDRRCWQFHEGTQRSLYRLVWKLYFRYRWYDDRPETFPPVP